MCHRLSTTPAVPVAKFATSVIDLPISLRIFEKIQNDPYIFLGA
jgi:hypothetical protein